MPGQPKRKHPRITGNIGKLIDDHRTGTSRLRRLFNKNIPSVDGLHNQTAPANPSVKAVVPPISVLHAPRGLTENTTGPSPYAGSDTEEDNNPDLDNYYLKKMPIDREREVHTVFGKGVKVWHSYGGTIHTYINDPTRHQSAQQEPLKPEPGEKRKFGDITRTKTIKLGDTAVANLPTGFAGLYQNASIEPNEPGTHPTPTPVRPIVYPGSHQQVSQPPHPFRARYSNDTHFHCSSAGIDPLGAHNRPLRHQPSAFTNTSVAVNTQPEPQAPALLAPMHDALRWRLSRPIQPANRGGVVVSGSFGSFEGVVGRFDERGYRLFPRTAVDRVKEEGNDADHEDVQEQRMAPMVTRQTGMAYQT